MNEQEFIKEMNKLGFNITPCQLKQFQQYYELLVEWNTKINLTRIVEKENVYLKHFYDSATIIKVIDLNKEESFCDVGTGAGFPGIVIKILFPHLKITLIDSLLKRVKFLDEIIKQLQLDKITTVHSRVEDYSKNNREKFDLVTARAVAPFNILLEYCLPLVKINKYFIAMKGNISNQQENLDINLNKMGCEIKKIVGFKLPFEESNRNLMLIKKIKATDKKYPRKIKKVKSKLNTETK